MADRARPAPAAFLDQLSAPAAYVFDLRRSAPATRGVPRGRGLAASILLISRAADGEFAAVAKLLDRIGIGVVLVHADQLAATDLLIDPARRAVRLNGRWQLPTVAWQRHFTADAIEDGNGDPAPAVPPGVLEHGGRPARRRLGHRHPVSSPGHARSAQSRRAVRHRRAPNPAHHRPGAGGRTAQRPEARHQGRAPAFRRAVARTAHGDLPGDRRPRRPSSAHSPRPARPGAGIRRPRCADPPRKVVRAAAGLAAALSLRYCAFDFLVRDGRPIFLELDPAGDWRWIESKAGEPSVTMAVTRMLRDLHHANRPAGTGGNHPSPFDLLAFLAG